MDKKNIIFVLNWMGIGGIPKSLANLLSHMEKYKDQLNIDLLLLKKTGMYLKDVPKFVNIIESKKCMQFFGISQKGSKQFGKMFSLKRALVAIWSRAFTNKIPLKIAVSQNKLEKEYDCAISFAHTQRTTSMAAGTVEMVLDGIKAKKKYCFMHGDPIAEKLLFKSNVKKFLKFDKLFFVSKGCRDEATKLRPELEKVADYLYNTQNNNEIREKSDAFEVNYSKDFNMVSVSRLEHQKSHLRLLSILKKLHDEGFEFIYHIVGDGSLRPNIEKCILDNDMQKYVIMHGIQKNPFPYVKKADLFVLTSYWESFGLVFVESMLLQTPVFATKVAPSREVIGNWGFICENTEEGIYNALKNILQNKNIVKDKRKELKKYTYDNDAIVKKLLKMF